MLWWIKRRFCLREEVVGHFYKIIIFGKYKIQLRLDWGDIQNGEPVLDADIWREHTGKKEHLRNGDWHHTLKEFNKDIGQKIYIFTFKGIKLFLSTIKTFSKTITAKACITPSMSIRVIRRNIDKKE